MEPSMRETDVVYDSIKPCDRENGQKGLRRRVFAMVGAVILLVVSVLLVMALQPPQDFPVGARVEIPFGTSLVESARLLEREHVVRSSLVLQIIVIAQFTEDGVRAGIYQFDRPMSAVEIARAVIYGTHGIPLARVTIPEGLRNAEIDAIVSERLPEVEPGMFERAAEDREGYLFPETYHVSETFTAEQMVALMEKTFADKIATLDTVFDASVRAREDVIIMASILEREADSEESMKLVSGILWKRFDQGMPLQVDASFVYLLGKTSEEVTQDDLKIDSLYNTYRYKGLPPTPINNPGLAAITAALSPTESPYLYYLTGSDDVFYYAKTLKEHIENKKRYLE